MEMPPIDPSGGPVDNSQPVVVVLRQKLPSSSSSSSLQAGNREKDKSTKRKSNLNRALTDEQILATGQIESQGSLNFPPSQPMGYFPFHLSIDISNPPPPPPA